MSTFAGILNPRDFTEALHDTQRRLGRPRRLTPWEIAEAVREGREWSEAFREQVRAMETLGPEDWRVRCR